MNLIDSIQFDFLFMNIEKQKTTFFIKMKFYISFIISFEFNF